MKANNPAKTYSALFAIVELCKLYPNDTDLGKRIRKLVSELEE